MKITVNDKMKLSDTGHTGGLRNSLDVDDDDVYGLKKLEPKDYNFTGEINTITRFKETCNSLNKTTSDFK